MPSTGVTSHEQQQVLRPDTQSVARRRNRRRPPRSTARPPYPEPSPVPNGFAIHGTSFFGMSLGEALELAQSKAAKLDLTQVASDIGSWIKHHPWKAAFYAASALSFFAPEILSIPALEALGFSLGGVRAGELRWNIALSSRADRWCALSNSCRKDPISDWTRGRPQRLCNLAERETGWLWG